MSAASLLDGSNASFTVLVVSEALAGWVPVELGGVGLSVTVGNLSISLGWEQE